MLCQVHSEEEKTSMANAVRLNADLAATLLDYLLHYGQPESNTGIVELCSSLKFAESVEELGDVLFGDSSTRIFHMNYQFPTFSVVASFYIDRAYSSELDSVFD